MEHKSHRMDITQLPRDGNGSLGTLRALLVKTFNYCRPYPTKIATLKLVIKYMHTRIVELEKYYAEVEKHNAKLAEEQVVLDKAQLEADNLALEEAEAASKAQALLDAQALVDAAKTADTGTGAV